LLLAAGTKIGFKAAVNSYEFLS